MFKKPDVFCAIMLLLFLTPPPVTRVAAVKEDYCLISGLGGSN